MFIEGFTRNEPDDYHGLKPECSNVNEDWSVKGYMWEKKQERE